MTQVIAERYFRRLKFGTAVVVRIYAPQKMGQSPEWSCEVEIHGLEVPFSQAIMGVDSFQALYLALRVLCAELEKHQQNLVFLDGQPGELGLPLVYPWDFGSSLKAEVYGLIDRKIKEKLSSQDPT